MDELITIERLGTAIQNSVNDGIGMQHEQAYDLARHVLNFFGFSDRIIDNVLEPEDRDAFYMLEDAGILTTEREETTLFDGREWRIHYWMFRKDRIAKMMQPQGNETEEKQQQDSPYADLPDDIWSRSS